MILNKFKPYFHDHPNYNDINDARLKNFMEQALPHLVAGIFASFLVLWMFYSKSSAQNKLIWLSCTILLISSTAVFYIVYYKTPNKLSHNQWQVIILFVSLVWGGVWSLPPFIFLENELSLLTFAVFLTLFAMFCTPAPAMVNYLWGYYIFITLPSISLFFYSLFINDHIHGIALYLQPFSWISLLGFGYSLHLSTTKLIILKIENEQSSQLKSKFLATASHDIRQPLQSVHLFINVLKEQHKELTNNTHLEHIEQSVSNMSELLDDLLQVAKMDNDSITPNPTLFAVLPEIKRIVASFEPDAAHKNLSFNLNTQQSYLSGFADVMLFNRVLNNLISNAIRYTTEGHVIVNVNTVNNHIVITVKDTGIGIKHEQQALIFSDFHREATAKKLEGKGLGLGLPIVKRLCDAQGWNLQFSSTPNQGSEFSFEIPAGSAEPLTETSHTPSQSEFEGLTVVLIDDEDQVRHSIKTQLNSWELHVHDFNNFPDALSHLKHTTHWPDVIVSDYELGDMTGLNGIAQVKQSHPNKKLAYLLISGNTSKQVQMKAKEHGINLLQKPIKPVQLKVALRQVLKRA